MESKKRDLDQVLERKTLTRSCYNSRKECIKKKTMELATLCGINACTIIFGADGKVESWPENPTAAKAIIKNFKDLTNNPYKRTKVRDESKKKDVEGPGGEVEYCRKNSAAATGIGENYKNLMNNPYERTTIRDESRKEDFMVPDGETHSWPKKRRGSNQIEAVKNGESVNLTKMIEKISLCSSQSLLTEYQKFLNQLDSKLEALTERIGFLRKDQQYDTYSCSMEKKQLYYSEKTRQAPLLPFDLNYPPADEAEYAHL